MSFFVPAAMLAFVLPSITLLDVAVMTGTNLPLLGVFVGMAFIVRGVFAVVVGPWAPASGSARP